MCRSLRRAVTMTAAVAVCAAAFLLAGATAQPETPMPAAPPGPLAKLLGSAHNWEIVRGLQKWDQNLTDEEKGQLTAFAHANEKRDWLLQYWAHCVLREHGGEQRLIAPEIEEAEAILLEANGGKIPEDYYAPRVDDIVKLGPRTVPLLLDMLAYDGDGDRYRKQVAIKALARLKDPRIVPAVKAAVATETKRYHLDEELLALLCHDPGDEMADYVASAAARQKSAFDQESTVWFLSEAVLPQHTKMRVFSHYGDFAEYGKHGIIRGLQRTDDADGFGHLCRILRAHDEGFRMAAYALGQLKNNDPCPVLLEELPKTNDADAGEVIRVLADRRYAPAIGAIEARRDRANEYTDGRRTRVVAAGALCRFGTDYENNAEIVREGLLDEQLRWSACTVASWLHDEETASILLTLMDEPDLGQWAIQALGQIGSKSAAPALMEAAVEQPVERLKIIGEALLAIGRESNDEAVTRYGQGLSDVGISVPWLLELHQLETPVNPHQTEWDRAAPWLAAHPDVAANVIRQKRPRDDWYVGAGFLEKVWNPALVPVVEEMIRTNEHKVTTVTPHGYVPHYYGRSQLAAFLSRKTGREYTFVDVDGTVRKGGEHPQ